MQIYDYIQAVHEDDRDGMMRSITEAIQGDHELECDIRVKKRRRRLYRISSCGANCFPQGSKYRYLCYLYTDQ